MQSIKYIGFFDFQDSKIPRHYTLASTNKIESIAEALNDAGYSVEIVSTAIGVNDKFFIANGEVIQKSPYIKAMFFPTFGGTNIILRGIRRFVSTFCFFKYVLLHIKKNEPVIVYHSLGYGNHILLAKKLKGFKLILEVEELYQDVVDTTEKTRRIELETIKAADGYIFPTELLNSKFNPQNKPYTIISGTYHVEPEITQKNVDGKIHVVYAGTFDPRKGGAAAAAAAAAYLPDNYVFHICGFGSPSEIEAIKNAIDTINSQVPGRAIYHGKLTGKDYISLLQSCHIGLSTQNPDAAFNATSFPSKILSYMANGLDVVTIDIPAIRDSVVGPYLHYYTQQTPEEIAKAITNVDISENNNRSVIADLYNKFVVDIRNLLTAVAQ